MNMLFRMEVYDLCLDSKTSTCPAETERGISERLRKT